MTKLFAYMGAGQYPGFVLVERLYGGDVEVRVRSAPTIGRERHICSFEAGPGRCTPSGPTCNNYCNMAPDKGPMKASPLPCDRTIPGVSAIFIVPAAEWPFG